MIKDWHTLTSNAKKACISDFFWNFGRTLPHAILTIFLIDQGCSLTQIATLQSLFMVIAMITEFPSGILSDLLNRKTVFMLSQISILASYLLIFLYSDIYPILCLAYIFYGLAVSLRSGTLDAEITLELRANNKSIKSYSTISSYCMSLSAIIGGSVGGILYSFLHQKIYMISIFLFISSSLIALMIHTDNHEYKKHISTVKPYIGSLTTEIQKGISLLQGKNVLPLIVIMFACSSLFTQPFFQYWQVLYKQYKISEIYFGIIYLAFQICNIIGTAMYRHLKITHSNMIVILFFIPTIYGISTYLKIGVLIALPCVVILYYVYAIYLEILMKSYAPKEYISSYISLVGTISNLSSIGSLILMTICVNSIGIQYAFLILFILFASTEIIMQQIIRHTIKSKNS